MVFQASKPSIALNGTFEFFLSDFLSVKVQWGLLEAFISVPIIV